MLFSCRTETVPEQGEPDEYISFGIQEWPASKGALGTATMSSFGVGAVTGEGEVVFDNQLVSGGNGSWDYAPIKLWPQRGSMVFSAYAPFGTASNGIDVVYDDTEEDFVLSYTLPVSAADQVDLLMAENVTVTDMASRPDQVTFGFSHILSLICVKVKYTAENPPAGLTVDLDEVSLSGKFVQSADYSSSDGWTGQTIMSTDYIYDWNSDNLAATSLSGTYQSVIPDNCGIYAIPNPAAISMTLYVKYTVSVPGEADETLEKAGDFSLLLEEGKRYALQVDIDVETGI